MTWVFLALISVLALSFASVLARVLMRGDDSNPVGNAIVFQLMLGTLSLMFALAFGKFTLPPLSEHAVRFLFSAILWAGATTFSFQALKKLNAGEATILTSSSTIFSITLGVLFLGEILKTPVLIGTFLILSAIWLISSGKLRFKSRDGLIFGLLSAACAGVAVINDTIILRSYEAFSYTTVMSFLPGIVLLLLFPKQLSKLKSLMKLSNLRVIGVLCFFYSIQAITFYLAVERGAPISQLAPFTKVSIVLTVVLAAIFLKETSQLPKKLIAAVMVIIGAILVG